MFVEHIFTVSRHSGQVVNIKLDKYSSAIPFVDSITVNDVKNLYLATQRLNGIPSESFEVKVTGMSCTINARQTSRIDAD